MLLIGWRSGIRLLKRINHFYLWLNNIPIIYEIRGRCFQLKERLGGYPALHRDFERRTGYPLKLQSPQTFHHKLTFLKISRPPTIFVRAVDKSTSKDLALEWAESNGLTLSAARTLAVVDDPSRIPWSQLPEQFVLKATHRSGANLFIDQSQPLNREAIDSRCNQWLQYPYGVFKHEWAYWDVPRRLLVEELIELDDGGELIDYKFHMSRGECLMIQVNSGFRTNKKRRSIIFPPWSPQQVDWLYPRPDVDPLPPDNLDEMLEIAKAFSRNFPFVRVDLYSILGPVNKVFFGEFTFFPGSGSEPVSPMSFDMELGRRLNL
jgi:hypothetical protein